MYEVLIAHLRECAKLDPSNNTYKEAADTIEELSAKVESPQLFSDNISKLPDCNTCPIKNLFEFMPEYSEYCRTTCPALLGEQQPPKEET